MENWEFAVRKASPSTLNPQPLTLNPKPQESETIFDLVYNTNPAQKEKGTPHGMPFPNISK